MLIPFALQDVGTDHLYNADTFNEMMPPSKDPSELSSWAAAVYDAMAASDPDAVWIMQGMLFTRQRNV